MPGPQGVPGTLAPGSVGTANFGTIPTANLIIPASGYSAVPSLPDGNGGAGTQVCFQTAPSDTDGLTVPGGGSDGCASGQDAALKAPVAGEYLLTGGLSWLPSSTGERRAIIYDASNGNELAESEIGANASPFYTIQTASTVVPLAMGETIRLYADQSSGTPLGLDGDDDRTFLTMSWLAPS